MKTSTVIELSINEIQDILVKHFKLKKPYDFMYDYADDRDEDTGDSKTVLAGITITIKV